MNAIIKIVLYLILFLACWFFGRNFIEDYHIKQAKGEQAREAEEAVVDPPPEEEDAETTHMGFHGTGFALCLLLAGMMASMDFSRFMGNFAYSFFTSGEGGGPGEDIYEEAEKEWGKGNHLEAIRLLRIYLERNPKQQHAALRIAEIYEKDMGNPLAAALEYEDILKQKLPRERWGWAAIHLANLYSGPLEKPRQAMEMLHRLVNEFGDTQAAAKARERLSRLDGNA